MPRRTRTIAVVSWLGGAVSVVPFAAGWFDLGQQATNVLLFGAVVYSFALSVFISVSPSLRGMIERLAGPPEQPARALVLVAIAAATGVAAMLAATALVAAI